MAATKQRVFLLSHEKLRKQNYCDFHFKKEVLSYMNRNVLQYLEESASRFPENCAMLDENRRYSYTQLLSKSRAIGSALCKRNVFACPVGVYGEKDCASLFAFFGIVYAGGFYCFLNPELPGSRLSQIAAVLSPKLIITTSALKDEAARIFPEFGLVTLEELESEEICEEALLSVRERSIDTDPLYINFTSGSTGVPKGIVVAHRSVIDFIDCFTGTFGINETDVIANQAPFDFDVSVKDIYSALKTGAAIAVVPRKLFSVPTGLIDFLCEHKATVMIWAVSALCLLSTFHALDYKTPEMVRMILFSGEVMPNKALKNFRAHLPEAKYVNLYGPTEITCNCTYHILEPERDYSAGIPIGKPFLNEDVFLLDENDKKVTKKEAMGEICVRGSALALGYYSAPQQNELHFVQNPLNPYYPERIYRTGDLGRFDENGDLFFCGRKDFQIKYMGHRIELEEIEREMGAIEGVERCCCIFDEKKSRLKGFYVGSIDRVRLHEIMTKELPSFMVPGIIRQLDEMPLTKNGKIDRKKLAE